LERGEKPIRAKGETKSKSAGGAVEEKGKCTKGFSWRSRRKKGGKGGEKKSLL